MKSKRRGIRPPEDLVATRIDVAGEALVLFEWRAQHHHDVPGLTNAEREVLDALLAGKSNAEVASMRRTSKATVSNQIASLFRKLGVRSRAELFAKIARR